MGRKDRKSVGGRMISRRDFLKVAGGATGAASVGLLASCGPETTTAGTAGETSEGQQEAGSAAGQGRLLARPAPVSSDAEVPTGLQPLGLGSGRDSLLYVPEGYREKEEAPLALTLHGAGGNARSGISHLLDLADEAGVILLAPESRGRTWDVLVGSYGPDVEFIDRALEQTFDRLAVNAEKLAVTGFSDGASYALSLGLTNGDLFTHVIAFSPGFAAPAAYRGKPPIFVSHGRSDGVLPIRQTSRQIAPELERKGYEVHYREFDGPHTVPKPVASEALAWFTKGVTDASALVRVLMRSRRPRGGGQRSWRLRLCR
jgi:phospholipase/carboxylesterase